MSGADSVLTERRIIFNAVPLKAAVYVAIAVSMIITALIIGFSVGHAPYALVVNGAQILFSVSAIAGAWRRNYKFLVPYTTAVGVIVMDTNLHTIPNIIGTDQTWVHLAQNKSANGTVQPWGLWEVYEANEDIRNRVRHYSLMLTIVLNMHFIVAIACWWIAFFATTKMMIADHPNARARLVNETSPLVQCLTRLSKLIGKHIRGPYSAALSEKRVFFNSIPLLLTILIGSEMLFHAWLAFEQLFRCSSCTLQSAYGSLFDLAICASVFYGVRKGSAPVLGIYLVFNIFDAVLVQYGMQTTNRYWIWRQDALLDDPNEKVEKAVRNVFKALAKEETFYLVFTVAAWLVVSVAYKTLSTTPLPNYELHISALNGHVDNDTVKVDANVGDTHGTSSTPIDKPTAITTEERATPAAVSIGNSNKTKLVDAMVV